MKIYNEIVFDVDGNVTYEDSYEYSGEVLYCKEEWEEEDFIDQSQGSEYADVHNVQQAAEAFSEPEIYQSRGAGYAPMYVSSNAQDYDVRAAGQPRNFGAYSGSGQYGSTARIYDTILMSPISTWSRDLASRFG